MSLSISIPDFVVMQRLAALTPQTRVVAAAFVGGAAVAAAVYGIAAHTKLGQRAVGYVRYRMPVPVISIRKGTAAPAQVSISPLNGATAPAEAAPSV